MNKTRSTEPVPAKKGIQQKRTNSHGSRKVVRPGIMSEEEFGRRFEECLPAAVKLAKAKGLRSSAQDVAVMSLGSLRFSRPFDDAEFEKFVAIRTRCRSCSEYAKESRRIRLTHALAQQAYLAGQSNQDSYYREELWDQIPLVLQALPFTQRRIIILQSWEEYSIEEISLITGMKQGTIKAHAHRARKKLHKLLTAKKGVART